MVGKSKEVCSLVDSLYQCQLLSFDTHVMVTCDINITGSWVTGIWELFFLCNKCSSINNNILFKMHQNQ